MIIYHSTVGSAKACILRENWSFCDFIKDHLFLSDNIKTTQEALLSERKY